MPFFSVVIPLYNKAAYIEDTLKSVVNQTFKDFEVIIVNDGSTDNSLEIARSFNDERIRIIDQENRGASITRNKGIEKSQSSYIALLDADDIWYENHLEELKKLIEKFPNAGLFCTNYEIDYSGKFVKPASFNFEYESKCKIIEDFFDANIINFIPSSSSTAFKKSFFQNVGAYDINLTTAQDLDLWIKMALKHKVAFNPKITMMYKFYAVNSLSKNEFNEIRYDFINKYRIEEESNASLKKYLDINRYALAIRSLLNGDRFLYEKVKNEISQDNLNCKQKLLLQLPKFAVKFLKSFQKYLIKRKIYVTAYK